MRLTAKTDYCLRVLIYLQLNPGRVKIQEIANNYKISKNHLSVAVNQLSELGFIKSSPGPHGGIEFEESSANRTVAELVMKVEGLTIVECFNAATNTCNLDPKCRLKNMFSKATKSFIDELHQYKIKDLASP